MSIEEARKLLGSKYDGLSDEQIGNLINLLDSFAKLIIENHVNNQRKDQE